MFEQLLSAIGGFITGIFGLLGDVFSGVVQIFYTPGTGDNPGELTFLGEVIAWTASAALVAAAVYVIYRLIKAAVGRLGGGVRAIG